MRVANLFVQWGFETINGNSETTTLSVHAPIAQAYEMYETAATVATC